MKPFLFSRLNIRPTMGLVIGLVAVLVFGKILGSNDLRAADRRPSRKPSPPIELTLTLQNDPVVGGHAVLNLHAKVLVQAANVKIQYTIPSGLRIVSGSTTFQGPMDAGETKDLQVTILIPDDKSYDILGTATITTSSGAKMSRVAVLTVNLGSAGPPSTPSKPLGRSGSGDSVIEFKAQ